MSRDTGVICGKVRVKSSEKGNTECDLGLNDEMASGWVDANGWFSLTGSTSELTTIDPELRIYHDCNNKVLLLCCCPSLISRWPSNVISGLIQNNIPKITQK